MVHLLSFCTFFLNSPYSIFNSPIPTPREVPLYPPPNIFSLFCFFKFILISVSFVVSNWVFQ